MEMDFDIEGIIGILDDLLIFGGVLLAFYGYWLPGIAMAAAGLAWMYAKGELSFGGKSDVEKKLDESPPVEKDKYRAEDDEDADSEEGDEGGDGDGDDGGDGDGDE